MGADKSPLIPLRAESAPDQPPKNVIVPYLRPLRLENCSSMGLERTQRPFENP